MSAVTAALAAPGTSTMGGASVSAVTGVGAMPGQAFAAFGTPDLDSALTVDSVAGQLQSLALAFQTIYPAIRVFGRLNAIGQFTLFTASGTPIPFATALSPAGPGSPQGFTVATLAAALLATSASYGNGPLYTYTPAGWAAVTRVRTTLNALDGTPYSVELEANPIQAGLSLTPV